MLTWRDCYSSRSRHSALEAPPDAPQLSRTSPHNVRALATYLSCSRDVLAGNSNWPVGSYMHPPPRVAATVLLIRFTQQVVTDERGARPQLPSSFSPPSSFFRPRLPAPLPPLCTFSRASLFSPPLCSYSLFSRFRLLLVSPSASATLLLGSHPLPFSP